MTLSTVNISLAASMQGMSFRIQYNNIKYKYIRIIKDLKIKIISLKVGYSVMLFILKIPKNQKCDNKYFSVILPWIKLFLFIS